MKVQMTRVVAQITSDHAVVHFISTHVRDPGDAQKIADEIEQIASNYKISVLIVNFSRLKQLTSAFLSKLITLNKSLRKLGIQLRVCGMSREVERGFRISKLQKIIPSFATEDEAMA